MRVLKKAVELDENNSYAVDLLEKAEAGKKRIDFANKDKQKQEKPLPEPPPSREKSKPKETSKPKEEPSPKAGNSNK